MDTKDVLQELRAKNGLTQDQLAQQLNVTRQAVSRWETGETTPNIETLKQISNAFHISINTLLGSPRKLYCQCCGMPLDDESISTEPGGSLNEEYCKWCYTGGAFVYRTMDQLLDFLVEHMPIPGCTPEQSRQQFAAHLAELNHWKK